MALGGWLRRTFGKDRKVERPFGVADLPPSRAETRERHYAEWLGRCVAVCHEAIPQIPQIDVFIHPPAPERGRHFYTLITGGMSDLPMHLPGGAPRSPSRAEILLYVDQIEVTPCPTEPRLEVEMLRFLARFPFEYETWLAAGQTVPNGNPPRPIAPDSRLTTALFLDPIFEPDGFTKGLTLDGEPVNLLWLQPITDAERQFQLARGSEALLDLMQKRQLSPVLDLYRPSLL